MSTDHDWGPDVSRFFRNRMNMIDAIFQTLLTNKQDQFYGLPCGSKSNSELRGYHILLYDFNIPATKVFIVGINGYKEGQNIFIKE